jgi:hypothetical protein
MQMSGQPVKAPVITEEEKVKQRYIAQGIIKPSDVKYAEGERPYMMKEHVEALKQKMIANGTLRPTKFPRPWKPRPPRQN